MTMKPRIVISLGGALLLVLGTFLPLWMRNGVAITGWDGSYFAAGRWIMVVLAAGVAAWAIVPRLRKRWLMATMSILATLLSLLVLWKGYKLDAIGWGAWVLLAGACLLVVGSIWKEPADPRAKEA